MRERLVGLLGGTRRARLATAATATAIVVAIVAFTALPANEEDDIPYDAYTQATDKVCVQEKRQITAARPRTSKGDLEAFTRYAGALVLIVGNWRTSIESTPAPPGRRAEVEALDSALQDVEIEAGGLARVAREGDQKAIVARAQRVDAATGRVEKAIEALGLTNCSHLAVGTGALLQK